LTVVNGVPQSRASGWRLATRVSGSAGAWGSIASRGVVPHGLVPDRRVLYWIRFPKPRESVAGGWKTAEVSAGRVALQKLVSGVWLRNSRRRTSREGGSLAEGLGAPVKGIDVSKRTARSGSGAPSQGVSSVEGALVGGNHGPSWVDGGSELDRAERWSEVRKGLGLEFGEATGRQRFGWTAGITG